MELVQVVLINDFFSSILQRGAFVSEPAILVKRKCHNSQIWSMEKFENKIIDMRELYDENKTLAHPLMVLEESDDYSVGVASCMACSLTFTSQSYIRLQYSLIIFFSTNCYFH